MVDLGVLISVNVAFVSIVLTLIGMNVIFSLWLFSWHRSGGSMWFFSLFFPASGGYSLAIVCPLPTHYCSADQFF